MAEDETTTQPSRAARARIDWSRLHHMSWTLVAVALLAVGVVWLAGRLWPVLFALAVGLLAVFFLRPVVEWLAGRKVPRAVAVAVAYLGALAVVAAFVALLVPPVLSQAALLVERMPASLARLDELIDRLRADYAGLTLSDWAADVADTALREIGTEISASLSAAGSWLLSLGTGTLGVLTGLITGLAVGFYLLTSLPDVGPGILGAMPPGWRRDMREAGQRVEQVVGGFIRGQLLIATSVGVLTWAGMALVGMPFPVLIGVIAGLADIVPYLGPVLATIVAAFIGLLADPALAVWAVVIIFVVQQVESAILQPKILGGQVGLHPAVVILAVVAATTLFGFVGLLIAIPLVGTFKALYGFFAERHGWAPWDTQGSTAEKGGD